MIDKKLTKKEVRRLFTYSNGNLLRRVSTNRNIMIGDVAGCRSKLGYVNISINRKNYGMHRLVFLYFKGYIPKSIDHIDGNPANNKIENLRPCNHAQNGRNAKLSKRNKTGIKGVSWHTQRRQYRASININGKDVYLGIFWDKEVAGQVVMIERLKQHGEFARNT